MAEIKQTNESDFNLKEQLKSRIGYWVLLTLDPLLLILHLTIIYVVSLVAFDWVLTFISSSFQDVTAQSAFAGYLLLGLKLFSAIGTAIGYVLHTVYQLYLQGRHVVEVLKGEKKK
jgi:hypothetical protein